MNIRKAGLMACAAMMLAGCSGIRVYDREKVSGRDGQLEGIPFLVKVPVKVQTTQWTLAAYAVQVEVKIGTKATKYPDAPVWATASQVDTLVAFLDDARASHYKDRAKFVEDLQSRLAAMAVDAKRVLYSPPADAAKVTANTQTVEAVLSDKKYFIEPVTPLFGSNDASFEFGPDGTLSKASTHIEDDTAKTALSLLPIGPLLQKNWGLAAATAAPTQDGSTTSTTLALVKGTRKGKPKRTTVPAITVTLTMAEAPATYTIKREGDAPRNCDSGTSLNLSDALHGTCNVQLVSISTGGAPPEKEKPGYEITGRIVPPATDGK
jgi:hypothetical protein